MVETLKISLRHQMLGLRSDAEILGDSFLEQARSLVDNFAQQFAISATFDVKGAASSYRTRSPPSSSECFAKRSPTFSSTPRPPR